MRKIIIKEEQLDFIQDNQAYIRNNSLEIFNKEVRTFLHCLLTDNSESISDYWRINGIKKGDLYRILKKYDIIKEINEPENETHEILIPKNNFDKKVSRVYYELFNDENEPGLVMTEDGEGDGGTSCSSVGGSFEAPLFGIQRRKFAN